MPWWVVVEVICAIVALAVLWVLWWWWPKWEVPQGATFLRTGVELARESSKDPRIVTLKTYVAAVKMAKANPDREFSHGLTTWWPTTGAEIVRQFREGMTQRINEAVPYSQRGKQL